MCKYPTSSQDITPQKFTARRRLLTISASFTHSINNDPFMTALRLSEDEKVIASTEANVATKPAHDKDVKDVKPKRTMKERITGIFKPKKSTMKSDFKEPFKLRVTKFFLCKEEA